MLTINRPGIVLTINAKRTTMILVGSVLTPSLYISFLNILAIPIVSFIISLILEITSSSEN